MNRKDTIHSLFEAQVAKTPNLAAVLHDKQALTYFELNSKINQLARYLLEQGVKTNTPVALCMERSIDLLISILAILKIGCAYLPLDSTHPEDRLLFTLKDNNNPFLITTENCKDLFAHYHKNLIIIDQEKTMINQQETHNLNTPISTNNLAYIIYTSGSTGKPKGVLIEHKNILNYTRWFAQYCHCQPKDRIDFSSNYIFDMAITTSIIPLMLGLTVVICNEEIKKNARVYLRYLADKKINTIKITPSYFKFLLHEARTHSIPLPKLKNLTLGGEHLSTTDCAFWLSLYPKHLLFNEYGPTEATVAVTQYKITKANISSLGISVPIGKPGPNMHCYILGPDKTLKNDGEIGELYIGGDCLARGYLNQAELEKKCFIQSPISEGRLYKTGDLALRRKDGVFEYVGRIDNQVKIRGFRIDPSEIEKHLLNHPTIESCVVLAKEEPEQDKRLIAYYISQNKESVLNASQMRQFLKKYLPDYMLPSAYVKIGSFPLTSNGKLDYAVLPNPQFIANQNYQEPSTHLEKKLAEIWSNELKVKPIGITDDFFELGGHSLAAARIVTQVHDTFGKALSLHDFYRATTIEQLAILIAKAKKIRKENLIAESAEITPRKQLPLSDFQLILWVSGLFEQKAKRMNVINRKRFEGSLDIKALTFAFSTILKKHEVLSYHLLKLKPKQIVQQDLTLQLQEKNLSALSCQESELELNQSFDELRHYYPWPKNKPLLRAKLFYLENNCTELQICLPHVIVDDLSLEILLKDLSEFYLLYPQQLDSSEVYPDKLYTNYILDEQHYFQENFDKDFGFWQSYLKDACLFSFPSEKIVNVKNPNDFSYTTYVEISQETIHLVQQFCANNHISIHNSLSAALALALHHCCDNEANKSQWIYVNIVKSTRDNPIYDNTLGCFLRLEPIKIKLDEKTTFETLLDQIHQAEMVTNSHQRCSNKIKFASMKTFQQYKKSILNAIFSPLISLYMLFFPPSPLDRRLFKLCGPLIALKRRSNFIINLNVQADFISVINKNSKSTLFGLETKKINHQHDDLLKIDQFFDVRFLYSDIQDTHYLAISSNLEPSFRELIAKEVIRILRGQVF